MSANSVTRNVQVNVIGDSTSGRRAATDLAGAAESTGSRISSAFRNAAATLSGVAGGAFGPISEALDSLDRATEAWNEKGKSAGTVMLGIGATAAGVGAAISAMGSGDAQARAQLSQAIQNTGASFDDYKDQIDKAISKQENFGNSAAQTQQALQLMTAATNSPQRALDMLGTAADLAAAKHIDLTSAATMLSRVVSGQGGKTLSQFGIVMGSTKDKAAAGQKAFEELAAKLDGQASASVDSFSGKFDVLKTKIEDQVSDLGQKYGPALTAAGAGMTLLGGTVETASAIMSHFKSTEEAGAVVEGLKTASEGVETAAETADAAAAGALAAGETAADVAGAPLLLVVGAITAAVALLVGGIYLLATHWSQVMGAIGGAASDAWHFIDSNFVEPVEKIFEDIPGFIKAHWDLILDIILGPIYIIPIEVIKHFSQIVDFLKGVPGAIVGFFSHLGSDFTHIGSDIVNGIVSGVESAGSAIWDAIKAKIPGSGVIGGALNAIGLADGGIVTSPTLAMIGEAGYPEAVIPLKGGASIQGFNDAVAPLTSFAGDSGGSSVPTVAGAPGGDAGPITIMVPLYLDGQQVGQATAQYVRTQLIRDQKGYTGTVIS